MKVLCLPDWREGNPYQSLLQRSLADQGHAVEFASIPPGLFPLLRSWVKAGKPEVIHLHWSNELIGPSIWPRLAPVRACRRLLMALDIGLLRGLRVRVVWTIHNLVAHQSANRVREFSARRVLLGAVDRVIVHSTGALRHIRQAYAGDLIPDRRVHVIQHGNYDGCYPAGLDTRDALRAKWGLDGSTTTVLFFGAIRPYKGIEKLLSAFSQTTRPDLRLVIAGNPSDPVIRQTVEEAARRDPRMHTMLSFIPDDHVWPLFDLADVVAIPFDRTLTSGSAVLAATFGKALVLPGIARELEFAAEGGGFYFDDDAAFVHLLQTASKPALKEMGAANRRMAAEHNWARVAQLTIDAYRLRTQAANDHGRQ